MLIILEGPDGAGKTTLAQELAAHLSRTTSDDVEVWHADAPTRHPIAEYMVPLFSYRPGTGRHVVLDRWHWGERVYPKVLDRLSQLGDAEWWSIEAYLRRLGALVVHCERDTRQEYVDVYRERGLDATPDAWQYAQLDRIRLEFTRTGYRSQLPTLMHVPGRFELDEIVARARELERCYRDLNEFTTYLGRLRPATLLLGETRNIVPERDPANRYPAFVPFSSSSGLYLLRALASLNSRSWIHSTGIANACDVDDVFTLWKTLGEPDVVALGVDAARALARIGDVPYGVVPHPQYVRRFHHRLHVEYGRLIYDTAKKRGDHRQWPQSSTVTADATSTPTS